MPEVVAFDVEREADQHWLSLCTRSFHACFLLPSTAKLPEPTSLFNPGVRELGDLRALVVDFLRRLTLHLGFECACLRRLLDTCD
jgi:hypothetical protein